MSTSAGAEQYRPAVSALSAVVPAEGKVLVTLARGGGKGRARADLALALYAIDGSLVKRAQHRLADRAGKNRPRSRPGQQHGRRRISRIING